MRISSIKRILSLGAIVSLSYSSFSAERLTRNIKWGEIQKYTPAEGVSLEYIYFEGAQYDLPDNLPYYYEAVAIGGADSYKVDVGNMMFQPLSDAEALLLSGKVIPSEIKVSPLVAYNRKEAMAIIKFVPIRKNETTGRFEKLVGFELNIVTDASTYKKDVSVKKTYAVNSILASGTWYRVGLTVDGVYKIDFDFLSKQLGIDVKSINPQNIRIYGNGGGMVPLMNADKRKDDLTENPIYVSGEMDGKFDSLDYVLFYGQGPDRWRYNDINKRYEHKKHNFTDTTYYFICADIGPGKRIQDVPFSSLTPTDTVSKFDDYAFHENDATNFIKSGNEWFGEQLDIITSYNYPFLFPDIDLSEKVFAKADLAGRDGVANFYSLSGGSSSASFNASPVQINCYFCDYAAQASGVLLFDASNQNLNISVSKTTSSAVAWVNYIEVNVRRNLKMFGNQMLFRDSRTVGAGKVALHNFTSNVPVKIWNVTDISNVSNMLQNVSGNTYSFIATTDTLNEYIAFSGSSYLTPKYFGRISNQDLHSIQHPDLIIVAHPNFVTYANTLANLHTTMDNFDVVVVTPQQIYNEFSSGAQDISAIRDFVKMFYDRANGPDEMPQHLLLFGDGSYDHKRRFSASVNSNFVPCYQSDNSLTPTSSYVSDDFYGLLDNNEGAWGPSGNNNDLVDIGIGRLPVRNGAEAETVVNKILNYVKTGVAVSSSADCCGQSSASSFGDWRNTVAFIADDEDQNTHIAQADQLSDIIKTKHDNYNLDKIYLDAYIQQSTPGGNRYPDATEAIDKRVNNGALIVNYTGHGGEVGLTHERVVEVTNINSWNNANKLPLFVTATCEFSRFDDPERTSAGELVLLNPNGGGIALLTTVRLVYASPNFILNKNFYNVAFEEINNAMPRLGDLYRLTKVASGSNINNRNFALLGDPALTLSYPKNKVVTTSFNNQVIDTLVPDTMKALSKIAVAGHLTDTKGNKLSSFNGIIYPTVYDKATTINTLSNDGSLSPSFPFLLQKNVLYKGKVSVVNGDFSFSFIVPKDIAYNKGFGRISYYADDSYEDASGVYENVIIGGSDDNAVVDQVGPGISLFMNDDKFVYGGLTNESPTLLAYVTDDNGINTVGNGIGHDITAVMDANTDKALVLNDFYEANLNSYQSGMVKYKFDNLSEGNHRLDFKVWDVYNNSSQEFTEFVVAKSAELALKHVLNYPNPFTTKTQFYFEHNQVCDNLDVQVQIYTITGKLIKTINEYVFTQGYRAEPIEWDGKDDFGEKIGKGTYVYRLSIRSKDGTVADKIEKLVVLN